MHVGMRMLVLVHLTASASAPVFIYHWHWQGHACVVAVVRVVGMVVSMHAPAHPPCAAMLQQRRFRGRAA